MDQELHDGDWLDAKLRDEMSYIDDAGFTAGVLQKLPAAPARRSLRAIILLGAALLASALAYSLSDGAQFLWVTIARTAQLSPVAILALALSTGLLLIAAALYAALSRADAPPI